MNIINNTVGGSASGGTNTMTIENTSNTASSAAELEISVGGTSAGDAWTRYTIGTSRSYVTGIDNDDSDAFKITTTNSATLTPSSGTTVAKCTTDGEWTYPAQPAFQVYMSANRTNVTGAGTTYTLAFDTETFDIGSDFNTGTYTFTAPVTGKYILTAMVRYFDMAAAMTFVYVDIVTSNGSYRSQKTRPSTTTDDGITACVLADMDASDTATLTITIQNGAGDTADVTGNNTAISTQFTGVLVV